MKNNMNIILGHLIGDYLFQSDWTALNKNKKNLKLFLACLVHCIIWTISMMVFIGSNNILLALGLFLSHILLDRTNLVVWYLNKFKIMPNPTMWKVIIVDNTLHLLMIYALLKLYF
jgi:hypothetical protein